MYRVYKYMTYNGISLEPYVTVLKISRPGTADISNETQSVTERGLSFKRQRRGAKTIKVDILIESNVLETIDKLNDIFADYPAKLWFNDQPDRYYIATLSKFPEPSSSVDNAEITLEFDSFDGVAHSTTYHSFTDYTVDEGKLVFKLNNQGNENAVPIVTVKHNAENGYIGVVNETGVFAVGDPEEEDGTITNRNEMLLDFRYPVAKALSSGTLNVAITNNGAETYDGDLKTMRFDTVRGKKVNGEYVVIGKRGKAAGVTEHAASLTWTIPADSNGEYTLQERLWWQQFFIAWSSDRKGFLKMIVSGIDENGEDEFLYGVETYKRKNGDQAEYNFFARSDNGGWNHLRKFKFAAVDSKKNPFGVQRSRATDLIRYNDMVRVYFDGKYYNTSVPGIKDKPARKVHMVMGTLKDSDKYINHMMLEKLYFEKMGVSHFENEVNAYQVGTEVVIDFEKDLTTVDEKPSNDTVVDGSQMLTVPPGESELHVYLSSWADTENLPEIEVKFEERWS